MIPKELLKKVRQIQIRTKRTVNDLFAGQYHSAFRGLGIEFEEVAPYQVGDDVRLIDWNVSARYGEPFIKKFREERELTVMLVVDISPSGFFGSVNQLKVDLAAEICAVLAFSAIRSNDKVGLILFSDEVEKFVAPKKGTKHVLRIVRELLYHQPQGRGTNVEEALSFLNRIVHRRSVCFLISDFMTNDCESSLRLAKRRHDLVSLCISDRREWTLPPTGLIELEDSETGETLVLDGGSRKTRAWFATQMQKTAAARKSVFQKLDCELIEICTDESYIEPLVRFFHKREQRR